MNREELIDINVVWHGMDIEPSAGSIIVLLSKDGMITTKNTSECSWHFIKLVSTYIKWAYLSDITPKINQL